MLAKVFLMFVFIPLFVLVSVAAKQKAWLAICGSLGAGMLLLMMVGMITPLNSTIMHIGVALFSEINTFQELCCSVVNIKTLK